jgi:PAS domain S-box-containing protein
MPSCGDQGLYQQIIEKAQDAIIFADREGVIQLWNSGAEAMFGYAAGEALGQSLDLIIPEPLRLRHWEGYRKAVQTGESRYGHEMLAVPAMRSDGKRISIEFTIVILHQGANEVKGCAAIIRDVTARWQREKAIKERLTALEAK